MPLVVADRVRETTTTTGTGTITLAGAVTGYQSFSAIGNGNTTYYTINAGSQWEVGIGTYTGAGPSLSRDTVLESSNSGSLVNFSAGTKDVFVTYPAEKSISDGYGLLPVTNGGTGATTLTANGVLLGNGTSAVSSTAVGTTGQVLVGNTGAAPTWATLSGIGVTSFSAGTTGLTPSSATTGAITLAGTLNVANGGTGATTLSSDYLVKGNGTSAVSASVVYDNGTNVGIGTASPGAKLNVVDNSANDAVRITQTGTGNAFVVEDSATPDATPFVITAAGVAVSGNPTAIATQTSTARIQSTAIGAFSGVAGGATATNAATLDLARCRGTFAAPTIVSSGDNTGRVSFGGHDGVAYIEAAKIEAAIDGTPGTNDMPGRLVFSTTADGSASATERMRITSAGNVGIGTTSPAAKLDVNGVIRAQGSSISSSGAGTEILYTITGWSGTTGALVQAYDRGTSTYKPTSIAGENIYFATGSSAILRATITSTGAVGIGTASPSDLLHVAGGNMRVSGATPVIAVWNAAGSDRYGYMFGQSGSMTFAAEGASRPMLFSVAGSERMRIDSSGNVGIGTSSPAAPLQVASTNTNSYGAFVASAIGVTRVGNGSRGALVDFGVGGGLFSNWYYNSALDKAAAAGYSPRIDLWVSDGSIRFLGSSSVAADATIAWSERMRIDGTNGNVGIGTSSPAQRLTVAGNILTSSAAGSDSYINITTTGIQNTLLGFNNSGATNAYGALNNTTYVGSGNSYRVQIVTNGSAAVTVQNDLNVGIGTSSPVTRLTVDGGDVSLRTGGKIRFYNSTNGNWSQIYNPTGGQMAFDSGAGEAMRIDGSGNLGIGTSSPASRLNVSGTTGFTWSGGSTSSGLVTIGTQGTGGSLFVNTASLNTSFASGLAVDGTYSHPSSVVNLKAVGVNSGGSYNASLAFFTSFETTLTERMRIDSAGLVGIGNLGQPIRGNLDISLGNITTAGVERSIHFGYSTADFYGFKLVNVNSPGSFGAGTFSIQRGTSAAWVDAVLINDSGNVGIGTTTPASYPFGGKLNVAGSISMSLGERLGWGITDAFTLNGVTTAHYGFTYGGGSNLVTTSGYYGLNFATVGSERMRLDTSGNLGLGTSTAANRLTVSAAGLDITSGIAINGTSMQGIRLQNTLNDNSSLGLWFGTNNVHWAGISGQRTNFSGDWSTDLRFYTHEAALTDITYARERMRIDGSGNVGIGTTTPQARLDLGNTTGEKLRLYSSAYIGFGVDMGGIFGNSSYSNSAFNWGLWNGTTWTERMRIDSSGNLLVGTTTALGRLTVAGGYAFVTDDGTRRLVMGPDGTGVLLGTSTNHYLRFITNDTERARISAAGGFAVGTTADPGAGAIYATGNITAYYSDERLKTRLGDINDALGIIDKIDAFYYEANETAKELGYEAVREVGVSAQSVQRVLPEVVAPAPIDAEYLTVRYERLVPVLIQAIKELTARVAQLEGK